MKKRINIFVLALLLLPCIFMLSACGGKDFDGDEKVQVEVYIDNQKVDTLTTNSAMSYKITAPTKPEDITVSPNSEKYFYGWFVDSNYQTPLTDDTIFTSNGKIYAKWINVYLDNFIYTVSKGKATITSFNNSQNLTVVVVPCYINTFQVETIGASVFTDQTMLRNVIICNGIKTIEKSAFYGCNSIESITLPNTLETIESNAFESCEILEKISLPNSLHKIGANAFKNCTELKSVEFASDGWWLANNTDYVFEKNVDTSNTLNNAQNLSTNEISKTWFNYELYTINYHLNEGQLPENAPLYFSEYITVNLVDATRKNYTFDGYYLDSDFTSQKVEKIEKGTTSFEIYAKWNIVSYNIEYNLNGGTISGDNLTTYNVEMDNFKLLNPTKDYYDFVGWYDDNDNLFEIINTQQCEDLSLTAKYTPIVYTISYEPNGGTNDSSNPTTYTIETPTITLKPATFENETVSRWYSEQEFETRIKTIPEGSHGNIKLYARAGYDDNDMFSMENNVLNSINTSFFDEFNISMANITIPDGVTSIGPEAFKNCSSLTSITIPDGVARIDYEAFRNCTGLTSITIPNSVTSIGYEAFENCSKLTSITIPNGVTRIDGSTFSDCKSLTSITIPNSVTSIDTQAFYGCSSLTSITIPNGVTSISFSAFYGCSSLTSITIPSSVTSIDYWAFYGCSSLTSVTIPDGVTSIGTHTFYGCSSLTSIEMPKSVTSIGDSAFYGCSSLTSITIPNGVTSIGNSAFYGCKSLTFYCETTSEPNDWSYKWNFYNPNGHCPVYWYSETQPTASGNYWHYVDGVVTKW